MNELTASIVGSTIAKTATVVHPTNIYGAIIGEASFVGPFTEIQEGVVIGSRVRIQSHTFICSLVTIGDFSFIGHGVMFTNDRFVGGGPARGDTRLYEPTSVGRNVAIGSGSVILPVDICDYAVIGAGSVVTRDIVRKGVYAGNPARLLREF